MNSVPRVAELLPLVYDEFRKLAAAKLAQEQPGHTLDATARVHEAYLRLGQSAQFGEKSQFFRAAAEAMDKASVGASSWRASRRKPDVETFRRLSASRSG